MNKKQKEIALASGLIAVGAAVYFWDKIKKQKDAQPNEDVVEDVEVIVSPTDTYLDKVKALQVLLGFTGGGVDGIVGSQTKTRLSNLGVSTNVNPSSIDSIIADVKKKKSQAKSKTESEAVTKARVSKAKQIASALSKNNQLTWIDKDTVYNTYKKDVFGKLIKLSTKSIRNNQKIYAKSWKVYSTGFIEVDLGSEGYIVISPYSVTIF